MPVTDIYKPAPYTMLPLGLQLLKIKEDGDVLSEHINILFIIFVKKVPNRLLT